MVVDDNKGRISEELARIDVEFYSKKSALCRVIKLTFVKIWNIYLKIRNSVTL